MRRRTFLATLAAGAGALAAPAIGQGAYPTRPIRLVIPFAPGGGTDIGARLIGEALTERLGQTIIYDNRPGANGAIAGETVARAAPDGYTLLVATAANFAGAPALGVSLPYDTERDFTVIAMGGLFPLVMYLNVDVPARTLREFAALARARPNDFNYGSAGVGGTNHLVMELIMEGAGFQMTHVPYRGAGPAQTDLIAGRLHAFVDSLAASASNIRAGRVRAVAVTTEARQPGFPDLPTLREEGVDLVHPGWISFVGPAGLPAPILQRLNAAVNDAMRSDGLRQRLTAQVIEPTAWTPEQTAAFMRFDREKLTRIVRAKNIRPE